MHDCPHALQAALKRLLAAASGGNGGAAALATARVAVRCLVGLLVSLPHFNYAADLLRVPPTQPLPYPNPSWSRSRTSSTLTCCGCPPAPASGACTLKDRCTGHTAVLPQSLHGCFHTMSPSNPCHASYAQDGLGSRSWPC